jgi:hypothetical protein
MTVIHRLLNKIRHVGKINALFSNGHYTQTGCLGKYAAERSQKHLILLKGTIRILAIRSIFAFQAKGAQAVCSAIQEES